jgi:hypothetical protein
VGEQTFRKKKRLKFILDMNNSYAYFTFCGAGSDFDPTIVTDEIGLQPTYSRRKGDQGRHQIVKHSRWEFHSSSKEYLDLNKLVEEAIRPFLSKVDKINSIKDKLHCDTILEIVMYIDTNDNLSTPFLGHDLQTIEFLHNTRTTTDIDIYRFDSRDNKNVT